jgi:hypothetical protein
VVSNGGLQGCVGKSRSNPALLFDSLRPSKRPRTPNVPGTIKNYGIALRGSRAGGLRFRLVAYVTFDDRDLRRFESDLKTFAGRAYPFATRQTINDAAFQTREVAQDRIGRQMVERNRWTRGSVRVERAKGLNVKRQAAVVGSTEDYMETQEFGGKRVGGSIPSRYASGEGRGSGMRRRVPRRPNRMQNIRLQRTRKGRSKAQANVIALKVAVAQKRPFVFMESPGRFRGVFRVVGGKRNPRPELVADLSRRVSDIPTNPWLRPSVDEVTKRLPGIYRRNLKRQLVRHRLFRPR